MEQPSRNIPVFQPKLGPEETELVMQALREQAISGSFGHFIREFEEVAANHSGAQFGVATTSGTTALQLALAAYGIGTGDEVILSTFTNVATCLAVVYQGATPVAVDSERRTWNMDVSCVEQFITPKTKAIMPVHIYGHPVDMDPLIELANKFNLIVIEDAAEAQGAEYKGRRVGALKDAGCLSFYANKVITTGEGGMFITHDQEVADHARNLKDLAFGKEVRFRHEYLGFNYRMSNLHAALGVAQMKRIDSIIEQKRHIAACYNSYLSDMPGVTLPVEEPWAKNVYWMYSLLVEDDFGVSRDVLMSKLRERGIGTRSFFIGMHAQPVFRRLGLFSNQECPVADDIAMRGFYLPSGLDLTEDEIAYVCDAIKAVRRSS
jgi:perosamine synthetase